VDELKKKVEEQQDEIIRLRKLQEDDLEAKLPTQCFTGDDSKALKVIEKIDFLCNFVCSF